MSVNESEQPRTISQRIKRRRWRWLLLIPALTPALMLILPYFGTFSPILSPQVYPNLAPPGWHNITPHGNIVLEGFATSTDVPGLMMACGSVFSITWNDPSTWKPGQLHFWRSRDGGAHWELLHSPFSDGTYCDISMPPGSSGTITATVEITSSDPAPSVTSATTWISHDSGDSWHQLSTTSRNYVGVDDRGSYYRHGLLYGFGVWGSQTNATLAFSADDGITWTPIPSVPSKLAQEGWQLATDSSYPVPDYRGDYWWYRVLSKSGRAPMLEHSTDDGRTWTQVGAIGSEPMQSVLLATTPLLPGHLCAAHLSEETNHLSIFASADGGKDWRTGTMPSSLANTNGDTALALNIGANGNCYQGYHYRHGHASWDSDSRYEFLDLTPKSTTLQGIPLGSNENILDYRTTYVPAGHGMPARLVANPGPASGWAYVFSDLATETKDNQLVWTAVP